MELGSLCDLAIKIALLTERSPPPGFLGHDKRGGEFFQRANKCCTQVRSLGKGPPDRESFNNRYHRGFAQ